MTKRYALAFFGSAIILIALLVGYGFYVNATSSAHVAKMAALQYFRVGASTVLYREIAPVVYFSAVNVYSPKMLDVHFEIDGTLTQVYVKPGDRVRAGQLLGEIVNNELPAEILQAEGKISSAEANVVKWDNMLQRYKTLTAQNAISHQQLDEAVTSLSAARGELAAAQGYREQMIAKFGRQQIVAPCDGEILRVYHVAGAVVQPGGSLVMIGDFSSLYFGNNVASEVLEQLQPLTGMYKMAVKKKEVIEKSYAASIKAGNTDGNFDLQIAEVFPPPNIPAQYRTVMYIIKNPAGLLEPGTYYQVKIYGTSKRRVLSVPRECLRGDADPFVFVVNQDGRLEQRQIQTGIRDDQYVEVHSGLQENETVVLAAGDDEFTPGMKVQVINASQGNQ